MGDKVPSAERQQIEQAIDELKKAVQSDDKSEIESKTQHLSELSGKLAEQLYTQAGEGATAGAASSQDEGVVDAEFEEVKDDRAKG
jgi:molecular chaperone DnaK